MTGAAVAPYSNALRWRRPVGLASAVTVIALLTLFLISSKVLQWIGIPYSSSGGSALSKFHPATFLALASLALWAVVIGPARLLAAILANWPGLVAFAAAIALLGFQAAVVQELPISAVVDTFLLPLALFIIIAALPGPLMGKLVIGLHALFLLNSAIGYVEYLTGWRLTPYFSDGKIITFDWRATALLGHPLSNALATGTYLLILAGPGGRRFAPPVRAWLLTFHIGAMAAFGGRAATVVALLALAAKALLSAVLMLIGRRFRLRDAILIAVGLTMLAILGTFLIQSGIFDSFLHRFEDDSGSAATRVAMFHVFDGMSFREVLFAPDLDFLASTQRRLDLAIGIESFVVAFFAYYGVVTTVLVFAGIVAFCGEIVRVAGRAAILPILYFFVISATSTGIASKTTDLGLFTATVLILLDRRFIPVRSA